jgi:copper chaperone CopZ
MSETTYSVAGMSCDNCVRAITREVTGVVGVTAVRVDLGNGQVTVLGEGYADAAVRAAIDEAGYDIVDA